MPSVRPRLRALAPVLAAVAALAACALLLAAPAGAAPSMPGTPVPKAFVGVDAGGPLFNGSVDVGRQLDLMVASGVQSIRVVFNWSQAQPYQTWADVPADQRASFVDEAGVPTDFSATDAIVGMAAARGLTVLPTVLFTPAWDAGQNHSGGFRPPLDPAAYGRYLTALVGRYGPHGSFWATYGPRMAIRQWQIWNEPNIPPYWPQPFASSYVKLLGAAHAAIKHADRGAKVVLGALTNRAWKYLGQIYRIRGASKLFDVVAVNGFTSTPSRVMTFLHLVRRALIHLRDPKKPLLATELSWPSSKGQHVPQFDWDTTERGQARNIAALLPMLAAQRTSLRLAGFFYYTWVTEEAVPGHDNFNFAGLLRYQPSGRIVAKPALASFRSAALALERCRRKGHRATQCARRA